MKTTVSAIALLAMMAPAMAWTNTTNGNGPQQIVDGGPGAQATSAARSNANATGGNARATGGNATASGGTAYGGAGGNGYGGAGGQGGRGGSARSTGINGSVSISGNTGGGQAPDIYLPSIGAAGMDCPTVGVSPGGSGLGGGGGIGISWISTDCNNRKLAEFLAARGEYEVADQLLRDTFPQISKAYAEVAALHPQPVAPVPAAQVGWNRAAWCETASPAERRKYAKECK